MSFLRNYLNKIKPNFEEGGKLHAFRSVFDGFETFLYVPNDTAKATAMARIQSGHSTGIISGMRIPETRNPS